MTASVDWLEKDYYELLGVPETATDKEITKAYRSLARRLHPDTNPDKGDAERFKDVAAAYDVLHDEDKRREYDEVRRLAARGARPRRPPGSASPGAFTIRVDHVDPGGFGEVDLDDLLGGLFDGHRQATRRPRRGENLAAELQLGFEEAAHGTTTQLSVAGRTVTARIPGGVDDGQTIRLKGRGAAGHDGGPPGDLLVRVHVAPHPLFGRQGRDLTLTVPVTFAEAALGADVVVPTLGDPVTVRIPPGTPSGTTLRVRGRGVPSRKGPGDLLVTVEVRVPARLNARQRAALEAFAAATPDSPRAHLGV